MKIAAALLAMAVTATVSLPSNADVPQQGSDATGDNDRGAAP
jgi:hypothetical protein